MKKISCRFWMGIATLAMAIVWIYLGISKYGLWKEGDGPLSGFFPVVVAVVLACASIFTIRQSFKEEAPVFEKQAIYVIAGICFVLAGTWLVGLLPVLLIFYIGWLALIERMPVKTIIIATVVMTAIVYGTFAVWLKVPFPEGLLFEMI
ncbi:tripartite tricarboxylate transporter TctB family protein [Clostridium sp. AM58-1XD]|uniref:tripartite tricarboxylate transporter TctB family protein n=1 Tax=Clostridium sp. AM58-1XD TaxID=2292307 RepID=UPI000E4FFAA0|nr:tripartite tricarboxylate transporter TctB family protein [Clostridium sp. AM58-1XD]RGZ00945.1 tripartite tricarboxylate transporter TctB [Clostridium sp. AM58-1XD]